MSGRMGAVTPLRVTGEGPDFVEVLVRSERDGELSIRFNCETEAPHGLLGLRVSQGSGEEGGGGPPEDPQPAPRSDAEMAKQVGAMFDSLANAGAFSGAVLLDRGGQRLFAHAYGQASRADHRPNTLATRFNLGSINKVFTSVAIHQLEAQGKLRLDDTIDRWLPEYPRENGSRITIQMLLDHRGGVPDFFNAKFQAADPGTVRTLDDWFQFVRDEPLNFEPGTKQSYSNGGYLLLGMIVAKVSSEDYYDYVRRHIYAPSGMARTDHFARDEKIDDRAVGYTRHGGGPGWAPNTEGLPGRGSPAGGGYSTVEDLLRFADALRAKKLPSAEGAGPLGMMAAGGSPGCNAFLQIEGPYTWVVLGNLDPPAAERPGEKVGRWLEKLAGGGGPGVKRVRVGGGAGHSER
jgi:CubicO group peptidase (beta-lactamase class C family)